ncbi:ATP-binding cassette domain-containing protein [Micromonospora sp. NPDC049559]|uniref:ATP-binding cassette domain-containing protein n=1 Tax=Micromonospora sp. NPDC049559 TaxID=3155923 RepID=UPI00341E270F
MRDVTVAFGGGAAPALDGVDLEVGTGERVALLGASGAGKSTLLRVLLGAVRPRAGSVRVGGVDPFGSPARLRELRRRTGFVRQRDDLVPGLSARANILMGQSHRWGWQGWTAVLRGRLPSRYAARVRDLARRHGIEELLDRRIELLSGGQRQRVALVRALLGEPELLLADETTAGLDVVRAAAALADLRAVDGATLLVTTHDLTLARGFPRVVALRHGRVVHDGPAPDDAAAGAIYAS